MLKRLLSITLIAALICLAGQTSALANTPSKPGAEAGAAAARKEAQPGGKLKVEMVKLAADAKAGKVGTAVPRWGQQPAMSNGLSKGTKIAIGVGIAAAIIVVVVIVAGNNTPGRVL